MLRNLIIHNIWAGLKSLRFMIALTGSILLFIASSIFFFKSHEQISADLHDQRIEHHRLVEANVNHINSFATTDFQVLCPISVLMFMASGSNRQLPNAIQYNVFGIWKIDILERTNFLLPFGIDIDWTFIIGVILSFIAITLSFDAVTGDKEAGHLRSVMANSLPRSYFILSKFISIGTIISLCLILGMLISIFIISLDYPNILSGEVLLKIGGFVIVSAIYLSIWILIGLLISSLTHRSAISLVVSLIVWIVLVLLIPNLGSLVAQSAYPIEPVKEVDQRAKIAADNVSKEYEKVWWGCFGYDFSQPCFKGKAEMYNKYNEVRLKIWEDHRNSQIHQAEISRTWSQISPTALYRNTGANIANVGLRRWLDFYNQVVRFREILFQFVQAKDAADPKSPHLINSGEPWLYSWKPIDIREIPEFRYVEPSVGTLIQENLISVSILLITNLILFSLVVVSFNRYDVR